MLKALGPLSITTQYSQWVHLGTLWDSIITVHSIFSFLLMLSEHHLSSASTSVAAHFLALVRWVRAKLLLAISWAPLPVSLGAVLIITIEGLYNVAIRLTRGAHYERRILPK